MAKDTPSMAKNKMRRCFKAILDPYPTKQEENQLWGYFDSTCAYCGKEIERKSRTGHLDHVISSSEGGSNSIFNHVLSCATCNGDEKREEDWFSFLSRKANSADEKLEREKRIRQWLGNAPAKQFGDSADEELTEKIIERAIKEFEFAVEKLRGLKK